MAPGFIVSDFKLNLLIVYQGDWEDKSHVCEYSGLKYSSSGYRKRSIRSGFHVKDYSVVTYSFITLNGSKVMFFSTVGVDILFPFCWK